MADSELLETLGPIKPLSKKRLLAELLKVDLIELFRYADDGPPVDVPPIARADEFMAGDVYAGWVVVRGADEKHHRWSAVSSLGSDGWAMHFVMGNAPRIAADDTRRGVYQDLAPDDAARRRHADELAAQIAMQALQADIYITERAYLRADRANPLHADLTVCSPEEALALVGLYLRAQQRFHVLPELTFNRGLFFWVGARELLPQAWRWFSAVVGHDVGGKDHSLTYLAQSALQRVARALEARDAIHLALNQPQNNDTRDNALSNLDVVLLLLMGAIDVTARVAHRALGIKISEHRAGWQRREWRAMVEERSPSLAAILRAGTEGALALTILGRLRNQIHGEALQGIAFQTSRTEESLIALPQDAAQEVLEAAEALGGREAWGLRSVLAETIHIDPGVLVERLFPLVLQLLNDLMEQTPVEDLVDSPEDLQTEAPAQKTSEGLPSPFDPVFRSSVRWQLGL